jgi:hypothetical protein
MDSVEVDLEKLRAFVSKEIFEFIAGDGEMTQPTTSAHVNPADPLEAELDSLLLLYSNTYEQDLESMPDVKRSRLDSESSTSPGSTSTTIPATSVSANLRRFAPPMTVEDIHKAKLRAIPAATARDTKDCAGIWNEWCSHRLLNHGHAIAPLEEQNIFGFGSQPEFIHFGSEEKDGSEFPPDTLHHTVSGIQRFLCCNGKPLNKPTADIWFSTKPIGHNTLEHTVARLCSAAGIQGFRTNHFLRATAATRLYQAGIDQQLIMETTGHRSLEGVRSYKRTSENQI